MGRRTWEFRDEDLRRYVVELEHGYWSGRRVVRVNGRETLRAGKLFNSGGEQHFAFDGHDFRVRIANTGLAYSYDLAVDGQTVAAQGTIVRRADAAGTRLPPADHAAARPEVPASPPSAQSALQARRDSGARWFYWIAGLSLLNAVLYAIGSTWGFAVGTAIGFLLEGIAAALINESVAWLAHVPLVALFAWFGRQALRGHGWSFLVGGALYALDAALILVLVQDWLSLAVHGFGLFAIANGWRAQRELRRIDAAPSAAIAVE